MRNKKSQIQISIFLIVMITVFCCKPKEQLVKHKPFVLNESNSTFVGTWKFVERLDENGEHIDTIWHGSFFEVAAGPLMTFTSDGHYEMKFTPTNTDVGKWDYDSKTKMMNFLLWIDPNYWVGKDLIEKKIAVKYDDGNYYEDLQYFILRIDADTLHYLDYSGRNMIYKRVDK